MDSGNRNAMPNVLMLMGDQITAAVLSSVGLEQVVAPNLAALASHSAVFDTAYCNYPLCAPSRASLMTGRLPSRIGAFDNGAELPAAIPTIAHFLRAAGYYTCLSGKMHFIGPDQLHGFEDRLTPELYPADFSWTPRWDDQTTRYAYETGAGNSDVGTVLDSGVCTWSMQIEYDDDVAFQARRRLLDLARGDDTRPFALVASFTSPHDPFVVGQKYWDLYDGVDIGMPAVPGIPSGEQDPHTRLLHHVNGTDRVELPANVVRRARRAYYAMLSYLDEKIGELLDALRETGQDQNTLIIFTSDHGEMLGERGLWFKKTFFEPAVRVPLWFCWPGKIPAQHIPTPVSLVDILPTVIDLVGAGTQDFSETLDGRSLRTLMTANDAPETDLPIYCEGHDNATTAPRFMVRLGACKYIYSDAYPPQLYDLEADPHELINRAGVEAYRDIEEHLRALVFARWDPAALRRRIVQSQNDRRLVTQALSQGKRHNWESGSTMDPRRRYVHFGDAFPDVERRGYVAHRTFED